MKCFRKGRTGSLFLLSTPIGISNTDVGKDPSFIDIKFTTIFTNKLKNYKKTLENYSYKTNSDWSSGKIELALDEISLRVTVM